MTDRKLIKDGIESRDHIFDRAREVPATADAAVDGAWMPHHF